MYDLNFSVGQGLTDNPLYQGHLPDEVVFLRYELAAEHGVKDVTDLDETFGSWPKDELDDGFEHAVASWRDAELEQSP